MVAPPIATGSPKGGRFTLPPSPAAIIVVAPDTTRLCSTQTTSGGGGGRPGKSAVGPAGSDSKQSVTVATQ